MRRGARKESGDGYMEWQPIETAPKDGTDVLLAYRVTDVDPDYYVSHGYFGDDCWYALNTAITPAQMNNQRPDFWMPLPKPPALK